jgi:putative molybdenum carrier protein
MRVGAIRSGGQSGVDRAALDCAIRRRIPYGGWCPRGGWAEDCETPPGVLERYPRLCETPSADPRQRTAWNVRDSHATLILMRGEELHLSPGTALTREAAQLLYLRPCLILDLDGKDPVETAHVWLRRTASACGLEAVTLNIAGPRESQMPGIYAAALRFLDQLLRR